MNSRASPRTGTATGGGRDRMDRNPPPGPARAPTGSRASPRLDRCDLRAHRGGDRRRDLHLSGCGAEGGWCRIQRGQHHVQVCRRTGLRHEPRGDVDRRVIPRPRDLRRPDERAGRRPPHPARRRDRARRADRIERRWPSRAPDRGTHRCSGGQCGHRACRDARPLRIRTPLRWLARGGSLARRRGPGVRERCRGGRSGVGHAAGGERPCGARARGCLPAPRGR